jgi:hypothetical protein
MKAIALTLFLSVGVVWAEPTNVAVLIGGRLRTDPDIEQLVVAHASRVRMQFDFRGVRPYFTTKTNGPVVVSLWCVQTNGAYFYAAVDGYGRVSAQELTPRDTDIIKAVVAKATRNQITQVWLGPEGDVCATTLESGKGAGEIFSLKRVGNRWKITGRGTWKTIPPAPAILAHDVDVG